jgi:hypothetical protein
MYFLLFFGVVIVGGALLAATGSTGIAIAGLRVSPAIVTLAYLAFAGFVGWLAWGEVQGERFKPKTQRPIELGPGGIVAPTAPDGRRSVALSYDGILELKVDAASGEPWLYIKHRDGKLAISSEAMESYSAFQRMLTSLELRVTMARGARKPGALRKAG